ncbi:MAG: DMT family transporter [Paracoccaceae bacterium]|nr:DMT family transporter [Paracoccaceae bacterium]MDE2913439.1 DMT family transporter [Paracoccaceae bacterium]
MQTLPYALTAVIVGAALAIQPAMNATLARSVGSSNGASTLSIAVALLTMLVLIAFTGAGDISRERLAEVPWWIFLAGTVGALFVAGGTYIAPVTGTLLFFVCVVAGQLLASTIADHFGVFGLEVREVSPMRLAGVGLALAGAVMVGNG